MTTDAKKPPQRGFFNSHRPFGDQCAAAQTFSMKERSPSIIARLTATRQARSRPMAAPAVRAGSAAMVGSAKGPAAGKNTVTVHGAGFLPIAGADIKSNGFVPLPGSELAGGTGGRPIMGVVDGDCLGSKQIRPSTGSA